MNETNGFMVIVGLSKGSGMFQYIIGTKEEAENLGNIMKENSLLLPIDDLIIDIQPKKLHKCNSHFCNNICEYDESYCMRCEDLMTDARMEHSGECQDGI